LVPAHRDHPGKIAGLLDLFAEHEQAFAYDWRSRFGLPLAAVFDGRMTWSEAWDLTQVLLTDPASCVNAAVRKWAYPMGREAAVLADLFDLTFRVHAGKKAGSLSYPRGWDQPSPQLGGSVVLSQERIRAELKARGHGRDEASDFVAAAPTSATTPTPSSTQTIGR
jgi:hypothetical protein